MQSDLIKIVYCEAAVGENALKNVNKTGKYGVEWRMTAWRSGDLVTFYSIDDYAG